MEGMTFMWILLAIAVGLCIGTFRALVNDGRPLRPPASHWQDPLFVAPGREIEQAPRDTTFAPTPWSQGPEPLTSIGPPPEILQIGRRR